MFEVAELGLKLGKAEFDEKEKVLRTSLLQAQRALLPAGQAVIILLAGVEGAGKGDVVNRLNAWLDSRNIETEAFWEETDEQVLRPAYWRFWRAMPARGNISIMFGSWYTRPMINRVRNRITLAEFERQLAEIAAFEHMLAQDGIILVKLWYHMSKDKVEKQLEADAKEVRIRMRASRWTSGYSKNFGKFLKAAEIALRSTDLPASPWHVVEASDTHHRDITTGQIILECMQQKLAAGSPASTVRARRKIKPKPEPGNEQTILDRLDPDVRLEEADYERNLQKWQRQLYKLTWTAREQRRSLVVVMEGWDAAGKGSTIRRITAAIDARLYNVTSTGAPTDEEAAHHYLWRFWRQIPMAGYVSIYDRSWYGRVLVERVEQLASEAEWRRAYAEINLFEQQLLEHGIILMKFWLHISADEQLRRFREREQKPWKVHKLTPDDWRNREKRKAYYDAVHDMVAHTSTAAAPWQLVSANDKKYARVEVLKSLCTALRKNLQPAPGIHR